MRSYLNLFGKSPIAPLQSHMDYVFRAVHLLKDLLSACEKQDVALMASIAETISECEHQADIIKNDIRNHLRTSLFLSIDKTSLLDILSIQDGIADYAEDVAVLLTLKPLVIPSSFHEELKDFLTKNIETFDEVHKIIMELGELNESSFGGLEAQRVKSIVNSIAIKEHEGDLIQRKLLKKLLAAESELTFTSFFLWQRIIQTIAFVSDLSEKLANRLRMMLQID